MQFLIDNMTCGGCVRGVTKAVQSVDAQEEVTADPPSRRVEIKTNASQAAIEAALEEAGFPTRSV